MADFNLIILAPDKNFLTCQAHEIVFDTPEGRIGIMANHMPMIASVAEGVVDIDMNGGKRSAAVSQGFAQIDNNTVELFVDTIEWADEIDAARARQAYERAQIRLRGAKNRLEYLQSQSAMARALARLKAAEGINSNRE